MKIKSFDILVKGWQRIQLKEPTDVSVIREYIEKHKVNDLFDDDIAQSFEHLIESEEYDYGSAEYRDGDDNYTKFL